MFWSALAEHGDLHVRQRRRSPPCSGLALALLTESLTGLAVPRPCAALLLVPWAVPFVVVAFLFRFMFLQDGGVDQRRPAARGPDRGSPVPWLNDARLALPAIMADECLDHDAVLLPAAECRPGGDPELEVIESARIDRARTWSMVVADQAAVPAQRAAHLVAC